MNQRDASLHTHQTQPSIPLRFFNIKARAYIPHNELNLLLYRV